MQWSAFQKKLSAITCSNPKLKIMRDIVLFFRIILAIPLIFFLNAEGFPQNLALADAGSLREQQKEKALKSLLSELETKYKVHFSYANELVDNKFVKYEKAGDENLEKELERILTPLGLMYTKVEDQYFYIFQKQKSKIEKIEKRKATLGHGTAYSARQIPALMEKETSFIKNEVLEKTITGKVTDENNEGLPGVNILVKGTSTGTVSDVEGNYRLNVPDDATTLIFSSVGYTSEEIIIGDQSVINLQMMPDIQALSEIVVVGYGTQKKSDLTGAVVSVNSDDIQNQGPKTNVLESVLGLTPGLNLSINSNTAEQDEFNLQVRGQNSILANNTPLIVVDGVPYVGGLNDINQSDVESINVLKDASSAAIYGARGANGVIIITTKKGKKGKPRFSYDGSYGWKEIYNVPDLMNGQEHWDFTVERYSEDVAASYPTRLANHEAGNSTDWVDLATRTGSQMRHNLKLEGGSERMTYFLSGTYNDVEGIAKGDDFKQYIFRSNLTFNLTDWLQVGTNTQYSDQDLSGLRANFNQAFYLIPLINAYEEDGSIALYPWPEEPVFQNPLSNLNVQDEHYERNLFSNNFLKIDFPFIPGLTYQLNTGFTFLNTEIGRYWGSNTVVGFENNGQAYTENTIERDRLIENMLIYKKSFGKHNLNFTGLYSTQSNVLELRATTSRDFPTEVLTWYQHDVASVVVPESEYIEQNYVSQMARLNYDYNSRYLLTLTVRRDGYSAFGEDNKFGVFPSLAVGWNLGDEAFMNDLSWLDQLKLRGSYGKNGNQAVSPYQTQASLTQLPYLMGDLGNQTAPGYYPGSLASPDLGWETSLSLNVGMDLALLSGRIQSSIDFYNTNTEDLLLFRSISPVHGIPAVTQNIGETNNRGIEFNITSVNMDRGDFRWTTNFNFARNWNKIVDLYGNGKDDIESGWFIDRPIDTNFGYVFDGVWQTDDDIPNSPQPSAEPGNVKVKDTNNDGEITPEDRDFMGQISPKFIAGLTNTFKYKNFTLSFILFTQQGATRENPLWETDMVWSDVRRNSINLPNWGEENPTNAYPANRDGTNPFNVRFYQDASFVRLRDVTLAYLIDESITSRIGLSNLRMYFNIRNGLTFTNWEGLDPEFSAQRGIPIDRTFSLGLNFAF